MQSQLPEAILKFKKIGLSAPWGDYLSKSTVFKEELSSFAKSDIFQMPYLQNINSKALVDRLQKGDTTMTSYIMPLFMMHIWMKHYVTQF